MTSRRGFLGAIAGALVLDPERALWVPGAKKIFLPPAPRVERPLLRVGDVVTFGNDPQRFVCMNAGGSTGLGATFAFLSGRGLPWGVRMPDQIGVDAALFRPPEPAVLPAHLTPPRGPRDPWRRPFVMEGLEY